MEFCLKGNALEMFARAITCLARVGNKLVIQASPTQIAFCTENMSHSAYPCITIRRDLLEFYQVAHSRLKCSLLLKYICDVLRKPTTLIENLYVRLPDHVASKVEWTLLCHNGLEKSYWITCNVILPDLHHVAHDGRNFPSGLMVRCQDLIRLRANLESSDSDSDSDSDSAMDTGEKVVELRSHVEPTEDYANSSSRTFSQSQHHPSNWAEAGDYDSDDDRDDTNPYVQPTPLGRRYVKGLGLLELKMVHTRKLRSKRRRSL